MKKDTLMNLITQRGNFGQTVAHIITNKFQKCGLPHAHILILFESKYKLSTPAATHNVIWACWPDPLTQPHLFNIVKNYMLHGPCSK